MAPASSSGGTNIALTIVCKEPEASVREARHVGTGVNE